jgi:hypothetical protein
MEPAPRHAGAELVNWLALAPRVVLTAAFLLGPSGCSATNVTNVYELGPDASGDAADAADASDAGSDVGFDGGVAQDGGADAPAMDAYSDAGSDGEAAAPPCEGVATVVIGSAMTCGEQNCSSAPPGDPTGHLQPAGDAGINCLEVNCAAPLVSVQGASVGCYYCLVDDLGAGQTFQAAQDSCLQ